jgi:hypothetical protein
MQISTSRKFDSMVGGCTGRSAGFSPEDAIDVAGRLPAMIDLGWR